MSTSTTHARLRFAFPRTLAACLVVLLVIGEIPHRCCLVGAGASCFTKRPAAERSCCCASEKPSGVAVSRRDDACRCEVGAPAIPVAATKVPSPTLDASAPAAVAASPVVAPATSSIVARARAGPGEGESPPLWILHSNLRI
jgi:hypothetical protein